LLITLIIIVAGAGGYFYFKDNNLTGQSEVAPEKEVLIFLPATKLRNNTNGIGITPG